MLLRWLNERPEIAAHDIVTRAMRRTGGEEFDGTAWIEPLEVLTRSLQREARLHSAGRRAVRADLVDLLAGRAGGGTGGTGEPDAPPAPAPAPPPTVIITGINPADVERLERALGGPVGRGGRLLDATFASMGHEIRWHIPSFAEWLAGAGLAPVFADIARRSRVTTRSDDLMEVIAATQFLEQLPTVRWAFPDALIVEIHGDPAAAADGIAAVSAAARAKESGDVEPAKVARYWRWRIELLAERRAAAGAVDGRTLDVSHDELSSPRDVAARVLAAAGVTQA